MTKAYANIISNISNIVNMKIFRREYNYCYYLSNIVVHTTKSTNSTILY